MANPVNTAADVPDAELVAPDADAVLGAIARGARRVRPRPGSPADPAALRRAMLQLDVISELLERGTYSPSVPATGGLVAASWSIRERGTAVFVTNPSDAPATGSVFPALPSLPLGARETRIVLTDFAIGPSANYLAAYAGLVKSMDPVLRAAIRPDPHPGALVVVSGAPGNRSELVLFHTGRGQSVEILFEDRPVVHQADGCLVVAWPTDHVGSLQFHDDGSQTANGWRVGPDGSVARWWRATATISREGSGRLDPAPAALRIDGAPVSPGDFELPLGTSTFTALWEGGSPPVDVLLLPDGACWALGMDDWTPDSGGNPTA